eukprot:352358-Chlamydomonas_euryale.AAC.3
MPCDAWWRAMNVRAVPARGRSWLCTMCSLCTPYVTPAAAVATADGALTDDAEGGGAAPAMRGSSVGVLAGAQLPPPPPPLVHRGGCRAVSWSGVPNASAPAGVAGMEGVSSCAKQAASPPE